MTVEEIIAAANNGNVDAALALARFFEESDSEDKYDNALPWYEKAAFAGSHEGLLKALIIHEVEANSNKHFGDWDEMITHVTRIIALCKIVFDAADEFDEEEWVMVDEKFRYACYLIAVERYMRNDFEGALHRLERIEEEPTVMMKILRGCAVFDNALETNTITGNVVKSVFSDLSPLEVSPELFVSDDTDYTDDYLLATGFFYLAGIIRNAPFYDLQRAYNLLKNSLNYLITGQGRKMIEEEMTHYREKLFGGLQYVN